MHGRPDRMNRRLLPPRLGTRSDDRPPPTIPAYRSTPAGRYLTPRTPDCVALPATTSDVRVPARPIAVSVCPELGAVGTFVVTVGSAPAGNFLGSPGAMPFRTCAPPHITRRWSVSMSGRRAIIIARSDIVSLSHCGDGDKGCDQGNKHNTHHDLQTARRKRQRAHRCILQAADNTVSAARRFGGGA